jgi:hypothetical protein
MSSDPSLDLQRAITAAFKAAAPPIAGGRIYDRVQSGPGGQKVTFPYVSHGPSLVISDDADCITGYEVFMQLDVWSREPGQKEVKGVAGDIKLLLHDSDLMLANHALVTFEHDTTRYLIDPDGITSHGAVEFHALVQRI